eukprot:jgi/Tetstr1/454933/TSEL_041794.t1
MAYPPTTDSAAGIAPPHPADTPIAPATMDQGMQNAPRPRGYPESPYVSLIHNDAVKAGHLIDAASRAETERRLVAKIDPCWGYAPSAGRLRVCTKPLPFLAPRHQGARQTRRVATTGPVKVPLPREGTRRVLLRQTDDGETMSELLLIDHYQLPLQPRVDSEDPKMDGIERLSHVVWFDIPQMSGLTGEEITTRHLVDTLLKPYTRRRA